MQKTNFTPLYALSHAPIKAYFSKNSDDFVVREQPLYPFSGSGEWLVLEIAKKGLSTQEMLKILSQKSGAKIKDFGVAGLKDKQGLTSQFISVHKRYASTLESLNEPNIKILSASYHDNKIKIGHLRANSFFIRLKKVLPPEATRLASVLELVKEQGFANYFGYQRFGKFGDNAKAGLEILKGKKLKNPKMNDFLISAFQSELFNRWLSKRVEISKFAAEFSEAELAKIYAISKDEARGLKSQESLFKLLDGEIMGHYPSGKCFVIDKAAAEMHRFKARGITSCGWLIGARGLNATLLAKKVEDEIFTPYLKLASKMSGSYRFAWSWAEGLEYEYKPQKAHFHISFSLQKGSYATTLLREVLKSEPDDEL